MGEEPKNETKPKFNGNLGFVWLIGILVILLGCTVVYTLKITKENKELKQAQPQSVQQAITTDSTKAEETVKAENTTSEEKASQTKTTSDEQKNKEITAEEKFKQYVLNLKSNMLKHNKEKKEGKEYREYIISGKNTKGKDYEVELSGDGTLKLNKKVVSANVIGFNVVYVGQDGSKNLYFIKDDGKVSWTSVDNIKYSNNGKVKTTEVKGLKNIISIIAADVAAYDAPGGGGCACAIDIEGNMFEIIA